jgi:hypothetical protein
MGLNYHFFNKPMGLISSKYVIVGKPKIQTKKHEIQTKKNRNFCLDFRVLRLDSRYARLKWRVFPQIVYSEKLWKWKAKK